MMQLFDLCASDNFNSKFEWKDHMFNGYILYKFLSSSVMNSVKIILNMFDISTTTTMWNTCEQWYVDVLGTDISAIHFK